MGNAKVKLSNAELSLVTDAAFILTKNKIISKVYEMFGLVSARMQNYAAGKKDVLPPEALTVSPKIYKGEQYLGLPYVMLDYPRFYTGKDVIAVRCLFWWGNFFSITLHLSGKFVQLYQPALCKWAKQYKHSDWYICVNGDAWHHHFEDNNYQPLAGKEDAVLNEMLLGKKDFMKLAKKIPIEQWDDAIEFFMAEYHVLLQVFGF